MYIDCLGRTDAKVKSEVISRVSMQSYAKYFSVLGLLDQDE